MMRRPVGLLPTVVERAAAREVDRRERSIGGVFSADGSPIGTTQARIAGSVMRVAHGIVAGEVHAGLPFGHVVAELPATQMPLDAAQSAAGGNAAGSELRRSIVESRRDRALARKQVTHFKCLSCAALVPNAQDKCSSCDYERPVASELCSSQRERERAAARRNTKRGRELNKPTVGTAQLGLQVAVSSEFEEVWQAQREAKRKVVAEETGLVCETRCAGNYLGEEESHATVFESFLQVHYFGRLSVFDAQSLREIDEYVVADFFNSIGNVKETLAENGSGRRDVEVRFPFGGYWQAMREATTADDMRRLRATALSGLGEDSVHVKNGGTFKAWYVQAANRQTAVFAALVEVLEAIARRAFAALYADGGVLHCAEREQEVTSASFARVRLPRAVIDQHLHSVFSQQTKRWLAKAPPTECVQHLRRGFRTEFVDGCAQLYAGGTAVQFRKSLAVLLRGHRGYDPTAEPVAKRAFYATMVKLTRARNWSAMAIDDSVMAEIYPHLEHGVAMDTQWQAVATHAGGVAARISEVFQEDRGDCEFIDEGEDWTLYRSKADRLGSGVSRVLKHRYGCSKIGCTLEATAASACGKDTAGDPALDRCPLMAEKRCAPCAKVVLFRMQGGDWSKGPSYRKLRRGLKFAFQYRALGEEPPMGCAEDFGETAQTCEEHERQLRVLLREAVNTARIKAGREPYTVNRVHFHGFRHGCALNLRYVVPKMTHLEIALHCRMSLAVLIIYLNHNQGARDPSNRTDEIAGVMTLSVANVARWCAERSTQISCEQVRSVMNVLGLDFAGFVALSLQDLQHFMRMAGPGVVSAGCYVMMCRAHAEFVRQYADMQDMQNGRQETRSTQREEADAMRAEFARYGLNYEEFAQHA